MALLALAGIILSIVWTWILILFSWSNTSQTEQTLSQEELQELINNSNSGAAIEEETNTWTTEE